MVVLGSLYTKGFKIVMNVFYLAVQMNRYMLTFLLNKVHASNLISDHELNKFCI